MRVRSGNRVPCQAVPKPNVNVLLITLDQFRGDCLSSADHPLVRTPNLDALAAAGVRLERHYSQAAPCAPGRASLYTGMYQMNTRVVGNGTPLDDRFDNVARVARRAGYDPTLFGYTDQSIDPRVADGPDDPRLATYEGVLPGFTVELDMANGQTPWREWLGTLGHAVPPDVASAFSTEPDRPAEHSASAFLTDRAIAWLERQDAPWFAHLSYWRPHPPYAAAGHWATAYDPADVPPPIAPVADADRHPFHRNLLTNDDAAAPAAEADIRYLRAQYFGMVSEVDSQLGRVWDALRRFGMWDDTVIVVTADHADQLGDHGLKGKLGYFPESYRILGIIRDPRHDATHGTVVDAFTENVDLLPTICDAIGVGTPAQCDGAALTPFLTGADPFEWRDAAHWEFDWRDVLIRRGAVASTPADRRLERQHLAVLADDSYAYVQFGNGTWLCFDIGVDPTWRTRTEDPAVVLPYAQRMLTWRANHGDRSLTGLTLGDEDSPTVGRWPEAHPAVP